MNCKIGIRPTIDGRWGGIREGLEAQTMGMAKSAKKLIEENVRYADGTKVEVVICDTTIGGSAEAAACEEQFAAANVTATLTVTPCWCYGGEVMDLNISTTKAIWGFNGTERPGAVFLAAAMSGHAQRGLPAFAIYGTEVQDSTDTTVPADVQEKLLRFARCAVAVGQMKNKSYVNIGSISMGIAGSTCDPAFLQNFLGIRAEWVDMVEILRRMDLKIYDEKEYDKAIKWAKTNCPEGDDNNAKPLSKEEKASQFEFSVKMTLIIRDIMFGNKELKKIDRHEEALGRNALLGGFQGQRQWTDYKPNADFSEAVLNSTFDWNGKREPMILATENDGLNGVAMVFGKLLTGRASIFADVRTYWSADAVNRVTKHKLAGKAKDGIIHLINSGAAALDGSGATKDASGNSTMKQWWDVTDKDQKDMLAATKWAPANLGYFRGGGFSSQYISRGEMPVTLIRVNMIGNMPTLQIAEGYTVELPTDVNATLLNRTDPTWPSTWFAPRLMADHNAFKDVYSVMANWGANHGSFTYGHIGKDLITMASMLRMPVSMHNVEDCDIYRPHAFSGFGTKCTESSDYRACAQYGPLYK